MDFPFPATPDMRYERMAMGLLASAVCFAIGLGFASTAWQAASWAGGVWSLPPPATDLRLWAFVAAAGAFLSGGMAFLHFSAAKLEGRDRARWLPLRRRVHRIGFVWARFGMFLAAAWVLIHIALTFTT